MNPILEELLANYRTKTITPVSGGDINDAYRVVTTDGVVFVKSHRNPKPGMFTSEALGLETLKIYAPPSIGVPRVLAKSEYGLVLEWIEPGYRGSDQEFGNGLAQLHKTSNPTFGAIADEPFGYLGAVQVELTPTDSWPEFFLHHRITPLAKKAVELNRLDRVALKMIEKLTPNIAEICGPDEPPALLHGDLWSGNRMVDKNGKNWLIDPSLHWGHREYDLAMMQLFGGFSAEVFSAYNEEYQLDSGWQHRVRWYQIPPLLVHAILFGGHYEDSALAALSAFA